MAITLTQPGMASGFFSRHEIALGRITRALLRVRRVRVASEEHARCANDPCKECYAAVSALVRRGLAAERFQMVIPAFPCKSPNPSLTLADLTGGLPDWAEVVALNSLADLVEDVRIVRPDARIVLALDGRLFEDLCGRLWPTFGPQHVDAYVNGLKRGIEERGWSDLFHLCALDGYYSGSPVEKRQQILDQWAIHSSEELLYQSLLTNPEQLADYVGIKKFVEEDGAMSPVYTGLSNSGKRQESKRFALGVLHRSAAWSRLIADEFPDAVRLSVHQWWPHNASKVGIYLSPGLNNLVSPWRGVGLYDRKSKTWQIVKRQDAEAAGAQRWFGKTACPSIASEAESQPMIAHIVCFEFDSADPQWPERFVDALRNLAQEVRAICQLRCGSNFSSHSDGYQVGLVVTCATRADLDAYRSHPAHQGFVREWVVGRVKRMIAVDFDAGDPPSAGPGIAS